MTDLSTHYLGFKLSSPVIPGASPLSNDLDMVRRLVDAGAPMIVMYSLFEEQVRAEQLAASWGLDANENASSEASSYLPTPPAYHVGPDEYLEKIRAIKKAVHVPVVASLNGVTPGGWLRYAQLIQEAGADAIELNVYDPALDPDATGESVEQNVVDLVASVRAAVTLPIAVKLSPFYSAFGHFARRLDRLGVQGLVLFNRLYQPDIDIEQLEVFRVNLSSPGELLLRLRWTAALYGKVKAGIAVTGGAHSAADVIKAVMAGASGVQMASALLERGPSHLAQTLAAVRHWCREHEYESLESMRGCMSLERCPDPAAYERANYVKMLHTWAPRHAAAHAPNPGKSPP